MNTKSRLWYVDNLRIFLISLVVLHHLAITYGAPGSWYYNESQADMPEILPLAMFVASNQSFFMGMFFFISAFFIFPSINRKGTSRFMNERLLRLGVPLLIFYFILSPISVFVVNRYIYDQEITLIEYIVHGYGVGFGPLWFVEALLLFTLMFIALKSFIANIKLSFPGTGAIIAAALIVGVLQFIIRIWLPVGWSMTFTSFQFPFFVQYLVLFVFGLIAWQNNWLDKITVRAAKHWFWFAQILIFIAFPVMFYLGGTSDEGTDAFMGGLTWQSLAYALWEQLLGFSLIAALTGLFRQYFNTQGKFARFLSGSAYAVFIFHTLILVILSALFVSWQAPQLVKLVALAPLALVLSFLCAGLLQKMPVLRKVL